MDGERQEQDVVRKFKRLTSKTADDIMNAKAVSFVNCCYPDSLVYVDYRVQMLHGLMFGRR